MLYWQRFLPFLQWIPLLKKPGVIQADIIAGMTVALVLIPQSMAYAQLANLPAYYGLYAAFLPVIIGASFGSSNHLATGPVALVSLLTASALGPLATAGSEQYITYAILLTFLVGIFQLSLSVLRLGVIVNFISHPVIVGFTNAAAIIIAFSQFYKLFGVNRAHTGVFITDVIDVLSQLGDMHFLSVYMSITALVIMVVFKRYWPKIPGVLFAVGVTTIASYFVDFEGKGGVVIGAIPAGLPSLQLPTLDFEVFSQLLTSAIIISLIGFMEAVSIAKAIAAKTKQRINVNQELFGQGLANLVGSFSQSFPVSASFSRSAVNFNAGTITGFSSVVASIMVLIALLFLTPLLYHLPAAVLASVIVLAVLGLINFKAIKHAWDAHKHDGIAAIITFIATLAFAPHLEWGIVIGAGLSLGLYLFRTMRPRVAILGRYEDGTLRDIAIHPELASDQRLVAVRFDGCLYFANISYFEDAILAAEANNPDVKFILVVGDAINQLDASGEEVLRHLVERMRENGVTLVFSGLKRQIIMVLKQTGTWKIIGEDNIFATEGKALENIYTRLSETSTKNVPRPLEPEPIKNIYPFYDSSLAAGNPVNLSDPFGFAELKITLLYNGKRGKIYNENVNGEQLVDTLNSLPDTSIEKISLFNHGGDDIMILGDNDIITTYKNDIVISDENGIVIAKLDDLLKEKLSNGGLVDFRGCNTADGKDNLARQLSNNVPNSNVRGFSTYALYLGVRGTRGTGGYGALIGPSRIYQNGQIKSKRMRVITGKLSS